MVNGLSIVVFFVSTYHAKYHEKKSKPNQIDCIATHSLMWFGCGCAHGSYVCLVDLSVSYTHLVRFVDFNVVMRNFMCIGCCYCLCYFSASGCPSITTTSNVWHFQHINIETIVCMCVRINRRHTFDIESIAKPSQPRARVTSNSEFTCLFWLCAVCAHTNTNTERLNPAMWRQTTNKWIYNNAHGTSEYISRIFKKKQGKNRWIFVSSCQWNPYIFGVCLCAYILLAWHIYLFRTIYTTFSIAFYSSLSNTSLKCFVFVSFFEWIFSLPLGPNMKN